MTRLIVACVALLALCAEPDAAVQGELGFCSGTAALGECSDPNETALDCLGQCPEGTTRPIDELQSSSTTSWACACVTSGRSGTQGSCRVDTSCRQAIGSQCIAEVRHPGHR